MGNNIFDNIFVREEIDDDGLIKPIIILSKEVKEPIVICNPDDYDRIDFFSIKKKISETFKNYKEEIFKEKGNNKLTKNQQQQQPQGDNLDMSTQGNVPSPSSLSFGDYQEPMSIV